MGWMPTYHGWMGISALKPWGLGGLKPNTCPDLGDNWLFVWNCKCFQITVRKNITALANPPCDVLVWDQLGTTQGCGDNQVQISVGRGRAALSCCRFCLAMRRYLWCQTPKPEASNLSATLVSPIRRTLCLVQLELLKSPSHWRIERTRATTSSPGGF